jgi:hypothetical protein
MKLERRSKKYLPQKNTIAEHIPSKQKQRRQLNTLHTDLSKLQPTKTSSSVETAGSFWYKQKVYICDLIA